jgi:hypothetical protein
MAKILIFKNEEIKAPRLGKRQIEAAKETINKKARVKRDDLVEFMLGGGLNKLEKVSPSAIYTRQYQEGVTEKAYVVPASCFGRSGEATFPQAESIRIWIKNNLGPFGIQAETLSVVFEEGD